MDGVHDLGGRDGMGPVVVEQDEPVYHEAWEGRAQGLTFAAMAAAGTGTPPFRHAIERMHPEHFFAASYYERWLTAAATLLVERGLVTKEELDAELTAEFALSGPLRAAPLAEPGPDRTDARFALGDRVRVRNRHPLGHTRCPGYVRGHAGEVVRYDGPCNFDDVEAHSDGKRVEPLYCVRFEGRELWGDDAEQHTTVCVDLFEDYLEPA
jgi:nitrile hydratase beta subunit